MLWDSLEAIISGPNPIDIAFVAPKPVPVTVTVPPGACALGVSAIEPAADTVEMKAMENIENISKVVVMVFLSSVFPSPYLFCVLHELRKKQIMQAISI